LKGNAARGDTAMKSFKALQGIQEMLLLRVCFAVHY